ncbi:MAG: lipid-binding SYLF domain-containing protein [Prochloraceae cyanobacterium]|nr:lipid-binding SYLF domain-containing protein [Prochloraceae cyanobacterium]
MKVSPLIFVVPAATVCMVATPALAAPEDVILDSTDTISQFVSSRRSKERIPPQIIRRAKGIAIFPGIITGGLIFAGTNGEGILIIRDNQGRWNKPVIVSISGGSFGLQAGGKSTDAILVFMSDRSIRKTLQKSFTLGGNVSVAAGPAGKDPVNPTDTDADIYSYTKSEGLFAGVALEGSKIAYDRRETQKLYRRRNLDDSRRALNDRTLPSSPAIRELQQVLYDAQK